MSSRRVRIAPLGIGLICAVWTLLAQFSGMPGHALSNKGIHCVPSFHIGLKPLRIGIAYDSIDL
jgi:hypothetical protein